MFRAFYTSSKLLLPRPLPALSFIQESPAQIPTAIYDVRRANHGSRSQRLLVPPGSRLQLHPLLNSSSPMITGRIVRWGTYQVPDPAVIACNLINMLKCVDLHDLKDAPQPAFWTAAAVGGAQLVIPLLEIIGGYSSVLTLLQLHTAAVTLGFYGGKKWGLTLSNNPASLPDWETMRWVLLPPGIAVIALALPYPLGFIVMGSGMVTSLYLDLKSCLYPPWACAMALFVTITTVTGLFLALSAYILFHNNEKKNKEKGAGAKLAEEENEGDEGGEEEKK